MLDHVELVLLLTGFVLMISTGEHTALTEWIMAHHRHYHHNSLSLFHSFSLVDLSWPCWGFGSAQHRPKRQRLDRLGCFQTIWIDQHTAWCGPTSPLQPGGNSYKLKIRKPAREYYDFLILIWLISTTVKYCWMLMSAIQNCSATLPWEIRPKHIFVAFSKIVFHKIPSSNIIRLRHVKLAHMRHRKQPN